MKLAERQAQIRNYQVSGSFHVRGRLIRSGPFAEKVHSFKLTADSEGRNHAEIMTTARSVKNSAKSVVQSRLMTWDGKQCRELISPTDWKNQICDIRNMNMIPWPVKPEELLYFGEWSVSEMVNYIPSKVDVRGHEKIRGHDTIHLVAETLPNSSGQSWRREYWLVPTLQYLPILSEQFRKPDSQAEGKLISRREYTDVAQVESVWLPLEVTETEYSFYDDGHYELAREVLARLENWRINLDLPPSAFAIPIPAKSLVNDRIRRIRYVQGAIGNREIKEAVDQASKMALPSADLESRLDRALRSWPFGGDPWPFWLFGAGLIIAGALGIGVVSHRFLRMRRMPH